MKTTRTRAWFFFPTLSLIALIAWYFHFTQGAEPNEPERPLRSFTPHDDLFAVHFTRAGQGWIVGRFGLILHSADGGKNWQPQQSGTDKALTAVSFADGRHGFAVGAGGTVLTTVDGGRTWQRQDSGSKEHLLAVHALNVERAFVVGAFGTILSTQDGGKRWRKHEINWEKLLPRLVRDSGYMEPNLNTLHFVGPNTGWIGGEFGSLLYSGDGGETWNARRYDSALPQILSLAFANEQTGWAVGQKGTFLMTRDAGKQWREISSRLGGDLYAISFDDRSGIAVGDGFIMRADKDASHWLSLEYGRNRPRLNAVAVHGGFAITVGRAGIIHRINLRPDGGKGSESREKLG